MEQKVRFKMHKVKKNWVTIGVTALSMAVSYTHLDVYKRQYGSCPQKSGLPSIASQ